MKSYLGLANYYRRFLKDFPKIVSPLNQLPCKDHKFLWTDACEQAFKALKRGTYKCPHFSISRFQGTFHLYTDASNEGVGIILG